VVGPGIRSTIDPVKTIAEGRWRDLAWTVVGLTVLLAVVNAVEGKPILSSTYLVSLPIAVLFIAVVIAFAKRRHPG
jgi:hypothetical protein